MTTFNRDGARLFLPAVVALLALAACGREDVKPAAEEAPPPPDVVDPERMAVGEEVEPLDVVQGPAYLGVWAGDPAWCNTPPGGGDPAPIAITEGEFIGYENFCRVGFVEESGPSSWTLETYCEGEGVEYTELRKVEVDGDTMTLTVGDRAPTALTRCP